MRKNPAYIFLAVVIVLLVGSQASFTTFQTEKAIVLMLGDPKNEVYGPGLHFKIPFIEKAVFFDSRVLDYTASSREAFTVDKKAIVLDNYARWRIVDPLQFYRTMRTLNGAQARLDDVVYSQLRAMVGAYTLSEVVSTQRAAIMTEVTKKVKEIMKQFGVDVIDVRIKRTDLPPENLRAIFGRMRAERERQAKQYRSEGEEESTRIRSDADRQQAIILAEANRDSQVIRGDADAKAASTFAQSYNRNPEFYSFTRWLETMRNSFSKNTKMILSSDRPLLEKQK